MFTGLNIWFFALAHLLVHLFVGLCKNPHTQYKRTNLVMTPRTEEMLDAVMEATGNTSRSECIRLLVYEKYELIQKLKADKE